MILFSRKVSAVTYLNFRKQYGFWGFLISLLLAFAVSPFFYGPETQLLNIFVILTLMFGIIAVGDKKLSLVIITAFAIPLFLSNAFVLFNNGDVEFLGILITLALYFSAIIYFLLKQIFSTKAVDTNTLLAAICVYFSLAIVWGMFYGLIEFFNPGSFDFINQSSNDNPIHDYMYFSFVTLTTVGYGDVRPLGTELRSVAVMEAFIGQIYLTVLVARLVGLHIAGKSEKS